MKEAIIELINDLKRKNKFYKERYAHFLEKEDSSLKEMYFILYNESVDIIYKLEKIIKKNEK